MKILSNEKDVVGGEGEMRMIPIDELKIDDAYQRQEVSKKNTDKIAREFEWEAFNSLVVMERQNGEKYVIDGQQRLLAARKNGTIKNVPCILFKSIGKEHEASAFIALNTHRVTVGAVDKFRANMLAGASPEKEINEWMMRFMFNVGKDRRKDKCIDFPAILIRTWNADKESCKNAILTQYDINDGEPLHSNCHRGFWWLIHNGISVAKYSDKLKRLGGLSKITQYINMVEIETGMKASEHLCGVAVLRLINFKTKNKVKINEGLELI